MTMLSVVTSTLFNGQALSAPESTFHSGNHEAHPEGHEASRLSENGAHNLATLSWWHTLGVPLKSLLEAADYTPLATSRHLDNFVNKVLPYFGSNKLQRPSFMTDNGCPVELSWDWGWDGCSPTVRYSMEPLCLPADSSSASGIETLYRTREEAGLDFISDLSRTFGVPLNLLQHFWDHLVLSPANQDSGQGKTSLATDDASQFFAGFDFNDDNFVLKAYFLPTLQAQSQGRSRYNIIKHVLTESPEWTKFATPFATLDEFMTASSLSHHLDAEILSLDVTSATPRRYKLYVRCHETTFASVRQVITLGGRLAGSGLEESLLQLRQLWFALFQPNSTNESCRLPTVNHRTAGILYYFEMCRDRPVSTPKIYLPVRHYVPNDAHIEKTVASFVEKQAIAAGCGLKAQRSARRFRFALGNLASAESMDSCQGMHTYIGCTLERGTIKLISYINPCFA